MASWLKDKGSVIGGIAGIIAAFIAVLQLFVVGPMNQRFDALERHVGQRFDAVDQRFDAVDQRFDATDQRIDDLAGQMNQRFDAQDERLDRLTDEVSELRKLMVNLVERVSRNEGQIDLMREQLQTVDVP